MESTEKRLASRLRRLSAHRILYYLKYQTSEMEGRWRDVVISWMFDIFELMRDNSALTLTVYAADGIRIDWKGVPIIRTQIRKKHLLGHMMKNYLLYEEADDIFNNRVKPSKPWAKMWRISSEEEIIKFTNRLRKLRKLTRKEKSELRRTIPRWVKEFVFERDDGCCQACGSPSDLHFDHILPFAMGGTGNLPDNVQLLCGGCNLEKSKSFKY